MSNSMRFAPLVKGTGTTKLPTLSEETLIPSTVTVSPWLVDPDTKKVVRLMPI